MNHAPQTKLTKVFNQMFAMDSTNLPEEPKSWKLSESVLIGMNADEWNEILKNTSKFIKNNSAILSPDYACCMSQRMQIIGLKREMGQLKMRVLALEHR